MHRAGRPAYYILTRKHGMKFVTYDDVTGAIGLSSCPHAATLFTSKLGATTLCVKVRKALDKDAQVMPTRTHTPTIIAGT